MCMKVMSAAKAQFLLNNAGFTPVNKAYAFLCYNIDR